MAVPTGRESDKFMLRLPDGMRERIKVEAMANNRSMNAEIVATLEERYPAPVTDSDVYRFERMQQIIDELDEVMHDIVDRRDLDPAVSKKLVDLRAEIQELNERSMTPR